MLNPDRGELRLQQTPAPESPKKNGRIPRWLRVPAFAVRTSLAILAAAQGVSVIADDITHKENPAIVYNSGQDVTINSRFDLKPTPTPSVTMQSPEVYKIYLNSDLYVIRGFRDEANFKKDFPIDSSRIIDNWGRTGISLKVGQSLEIFASGKVNTCPYIYCGGNPYEWAETCKESPEWFFSLTSWGKVN